MYIYIYIVYIDDRYPKFLSTKFPGFHRPARLLPRLWNRPDRARSCWRKRSAGRCLGAWGDFSWRFT